MSNASDWKDRQVSNRPDPSWTVVTTLVSPENRGWLGESWEFFDDERDAMKCFKRHRIAGHVPTMRPYYRNMDWQHLNVVQRPPRT